MKCRKHNNQLDELKLWYLDNLRELDYDNETIRNFENFMYRIRSFEVQYTEPKLINEYNYDELITFLKSLGSSSEDSLAIYVSMIRKFFLFCIKQGKMDDSIDFTRTIDYKTLTRCVDKRKHANRYVTEKDINELTDKLINDTDKAYVQLLFEGVEGKEHSEILNLKKEDIDFGNNTLKIKKGGVVERVAIISEKLSDILDRVLDTELVYNDNDYDSKIDILATSEYVFRPTERFLNLNATKSKIENGEYNGKHVESATLSTRLFKITKKWGGLDYVTPTNLYKSGVINRAIKSIGLETSKQDFAEWIVENERYSLCVAYKMYSAYKDIIKQLDQENEQE